MTVSPAKISPPRPGADRIDRAPLQSRLRAALRRCPLLVLQAPPGYGKTTALAELGAGFAREGALAWVRVDATDSLASLVGALLLALDPLDLPWPRSERALVAAAAAGGAAAWPAEQLAQGLAACERAAGLVVFDDLHGTPDAQVPSFLAALADGLPASWRLALGSRTPVLPDLARRVLRGQATLFDSTELAFDAREACALAERLGVADRFDGSDLHAWCGGWPAALRLALTARARNSPAAGRAFDDLCAEVLDMLDAELREFLLLTAPLAELEPGRAAALSDHPRIGELLRRLGQLGLLVSELQTQGPLRLHDLLREALMRRLRSERPDRWREQLRRAAASEPDPLRRVEAWRVAGDPGEAAAALLATAADQIADGLGPLVRQTLNRFDARQRLGDPALAIVQAQLAWSEWDFDAMARALRRCQAPTGGELRELYHAYRACAFDGLLLEHECRQELSMLEGQAPSPLARLLALSCRLQAPGDDLQVARVAADLDAMMQQAECIGSAAAWLQAAPPVQLALLPGARPALLRYARSTAELCAGQANALRMWSLLAEGWLPMWRGDWPAAAALFAAAERDALWEGAEGAGLAHVHASRALAEALRGDAQACLHHREHHARLMRRTAAHDGRLSALVQSLEVELELRTAVWLADAEAMRRGLARAAGVGAARLALAALVDHGHAVLDLRAGRAEAAAQRWRAWSDRLPALHGQGLASELQLRLAAAEAACGRAQACQALLQQVCSRLAAGLEDGPALMAGPRSIGELLAWAGSRGVDAALQARLRQWHSGGNAPPARPADDAATLLSARERQVLQRLAAGDTNKHIAQRLDLSPHTVKRHVANILEKLDARTRGQAAAWWRAQGAGGQGPAAPGGR